MLLLTRQLPAGPLSRPEGLSEYGSWTSEIREIHDQLGRGIPESRLRARLRHGMRFYVLHDKGAVVGTAWLATGPERFIDEAAVVLAVPADGLWLCDIYVPSSERGRGRFAQVLDAALACHAGAVALWSDVKLSNTSSIRAHVGYGFRPAGTVRALHLGQRLLVRSAVEGDV